MGFEHVYTGCTRSLGFVQYAGTKITRESMISQRLRCGFLSISCSWTVCHNHCCGLQRRNSCRYLDYLIMFTRLLFQSQLQNLILGRIQCDVHVYTQQNKALECAQRRYIGTLKANETSEVTSRELPRCTFASIPSHLFGD